MGSLSDLADAQILVTGGLGFIGSNLALSLADAGAKVRVLDALIPRHGGDVRNIGDHENVSVTTGNIADGELVATLLAGTDFVFNIAGQVSHHESMLDPLADTDFNVTAQLKFLETVRRARPTAAVVHTSTRQVYGAAQYLPVDENHPTVPRDINGVNKLAGENYHRLYGTVHSMPTVSLRLTNVFGPRQCLNKPGLGFMPVFVSRVLRGETLEVFGDGRQQRDCLYVDDVIEALVAAALGVSTGRIPYGDVINLGHQEVLTLMEIAEKMSAMAQSGSFVKKTAWPEELALIDIGGFAGDYSKAHRVLGWNPEVSFGDGLSRTFDFYRSNSWYL